MLHLHLIPTCAGLAVALLAFVPSPARSAPVDFVRDVQPIFRAHCYECHGPKKQESGFRLDDRTAAMKGGDIGRSIVPGKSGESLLIQAVTGTAETVSKMPAKGEPLSSAQITTLKNWIDQGANWPVSADSTKRLGKDHWAFKPPTRGTIPSVNNAAWCRGPIDRFVLSRLDQDKLQPSEEAQRLALVRRMYLDLVGLPPSPADADAVVADANPDALERLTDRLLASPHYGERWGRHWLDAARYADSDGFEKDKSRFIWFYRDWVVGAFNRGLPYDQFLIEQLAGDLLPGATQDQIAATGYLRNSMINEEGGIDPEQFRMEAMFDRMDAIGKGVLGLTIQCAQCHNHKFDPLTQEEYYRLFAFLNNDHESHRVVYTPRELMQIDELRRQMQGIDAELQHRTPNWPERQALWESQVKANQPDWDIIEPDYYAEPGGGAKLLLHKDYSMLCAGYAPTKCGYTVTGKTPLKSVTALRLELLTDPNLPCGGPGRSFKGTCALTEITIEAAPANDPKKRKKIKIARATADYQQPDSPLEPNFDDRSGKKKRIGPIAFAFDGSQDTAWSIDAGPGRRNQDRKAVFQFDKPVEFAEGTIITVNLAQNHGGWNSDDHQNNLIGRFRVSVTGSVAPVEADPLPRLVLDVLSIPAGQRTASQEAAVFASFRASVSDWKADIERIESLWRQWPTGATTLTFTARDEGRTTSVLRRGDFLKPVRPVSVGVPEFLHSLPDNSPPTRLTFARWVADRDSPTTARAFVNRAWQSYFGTGIVSTSEDFGLQSEAPSHRELLDFLASDFMEADWNIKRLHRAVVGSAVYRQSSRVTSDALARDPFNRLLARGSRYRVEGEIVRDVALSASGMLSTRIGGPSIFAPAPAFLFLPPTSYAPFPWVEATGEDRYRRAIYTFRRRSTPFPALTNFDVPNADAACVRRTRSNTPMQALTTLNETVFLESARALARQALLHGGATDAERIDFAFRQCVTRAPTADERTELLSLLDRQRSRFAEGWANPTEVATGQTDRPRDLPATITPTQWAAYTLVARVILNLDETITRE